MPDIKIGMSKSRNQKTGKHCIVPSLKIQANTFKNKNTRENMSAFLIKN